MCGRLNVTENPYLIEICTQLGLNFDYDNGQLITSRFLRATDRISIIRKSNNVVSLESAIWWLLLEESDTGFKPSKYTSFNTRYDKLNVPRSAGYQPFRESRCLIPATGFGETEFENKKPKYYYDFEALEGEVIFFGGLYKEWIHPMTGKCVLSCSIITLPPHEKLSQFHNKAMPLILPQSDNTVDMWLDPKLTNTDIFTDLLKPNLPQDLLVYQIDKPSWHNKLGEKHFICKDVRSVI